MVNTDLLLKNIDSLTDKVVYLGYDGRRVTFNAYQVFETVMRAFQNDAVESVSYGCMLSEPVNAPGVFTLSRDGQMKIQTRESYEKYGAGI